MKRAIKNTEIKNLKLTVIFNKSQVTHKVGSVLEALKILIMRYPRSGTFAYIDSDSGDSHVAFERNTRWEIAYTIDKNTTIVCETEAA